MVFLTGARARVGGPCAVFHLAVVLEEGHVVGRGLDAQHAAELVVHLDRALAEAVLDAGPFDAGGELRADLLGQLRGDLAAEEAGDLLGLDAQHRLAGQLFVERPERGGGAEHQVGGVFHLHQAPVVGLPEHVEHRAALRGIAVQHAVQLVGRQACRPVPGRAASRRSARRRCRPW